MKVLVIEDTPEVVATIRVCLTMRWPDVTVLSTERGRDAPELVESLSPDMVILDLGLPDMDGLDVLHEIRRFSDLPLMIVTARGDETARVTGLELGADDYIVKPFSYTELMARAKAVLRRTYMPELRHDEGIVAGAGLSIDVAGRRLIVEGHEVSLTPTEWRLLACLVRNQGRVVSHQVLAERVWGTDFLNDSAIKMCVRRLRVKLGQYLQAPAIIRTHRGMGYSFAVPAQA
jgi:two-component system KDP operon response regulator KdpE